MALLIIKAAWDITRKSVGGLIDTRLPEYEEEIIGVAITEHVGELTGFHDLRTRKGGSYRYIDLHLVFPKAVTLEEAHRLCDHLEEDIMGKLSSSVITVHFEPCDQDGDGICPTDCPIVDGDQCRWRNPDD